MISPDESNERRYAESLFLRTLDELEQRAKSNDSHDILEIAKFLRELLLDESRLTDKINRYYQLPIIYTVMNRKQKGRATSRIPMWTSQDGLDPDTRVGSGKLVTLKGMHS